MNPAPPVTRYRSGTTGLYQVRASTLDGRHLGRSPAAGALRGLAGDHAVVAQLEQRCPSLQKARPDLEGHAGITQALPAIVAKERSEAARRRHRFLNCLSADKRA